VPTFYDFRTFKNLLNGGLWVGGGANCLCFRITLTIHKT
jgi:hypothetical protein